MVLTVVFIILYVKEREKARKAENRIQFNSMPAMTEVSTSENPFDDPRQNAGSRLGPEETESPAYHSKE